MPRIAPDPEKGLYWLLLALLAWLPIPLGSNRPWAWMVMEVWVFALLAAWLVLWLMGRARLSEPARRAWPAWVLLALWMLLQLLHLLPMPRDWVALLSPEAARMHGLVEAFGVRRELITLSIDPHASRISILKSAAYVGVFFLVLNLVHRRSRLLALARTLVYAAVLVAVYGVMLHLSDVQHDYFGTLLSHGPSATATFGNRNHFAGYLEMTSALGIGLLLAGLSDRGSDSWKKLVRQTLDWILSPKMILRLALAILVIALTTTHSRMGNTAFFASLLVAGLVGIALSRRATRNTVILLASLVVIDLLIVGSWFGVERLAQRLEQTTAGEVQQREEPAVHTIPLIRDYPVFGVGPGAFYVAFPRYRPESVVNFYDYAHNDYAQLAAESGVLGFGLLGLLVALSLGAALMAQWRRRDPLMRGMSFACVMGVTSILIHSWVDFNLQIPSNAAYFMVLLALGWIALHHDRQPGLPNVRAPAE